MTCVQHMSWRYRIIRWKQIVMDGPCTLVGAFVIFLLYYEVLRLCSFFNYRCSDCCVFVLVVNWRACGCHVAHAWGETCFASVFSKHIRTAYRLMKHLSISTCVAKILHRISLDNWNNHLHLIGINIQSV